MCFCSVMWKHVSTNKIYCDYTSLVLYIFKEKNNPHFPVCTLEQTSDTFIKMLIQTIHIYISDANGILKLLFQYKVVEEQFHFMFTFNSYDLKFYASGFSLWPNEQNFITHAINLSLWNYYIYKISYGQLSSSSEFISLIINHPN